MFFFIFAFIAMLNESFGQSVIIRWESASETSILQIKDPSGIVSEYKVKEKFYELPIIIPGDYYWRIKAFEENKVTSDFSDWGLIKASDSILEVSKPLMASPRNNRSMTLKEDGALITLKFKTPKPTWEYFVEVWVDEKKILDQKTDEDFYKFRITQEAKEIRWKVSAKSKYGNTTPPTAFWKVNLLPFVVVEKPLQKPVKFKLTAALKKDQVLLTWKAQENCPAYVVYLEDSKLGETNVPEYLAPISTQKQTVLVECENNKLNYGKISLVKKEPEIKTPSKSKFYYQFGLSQFRISQNISNNALVPSSFDNSFIIQSHAFGYNFQWGKEDRHSLAPSLKYGRPLNFSSDVVVLSIGGLLKYAPLKNPQQKFLGEFAQMRVDYNFDTKASLSQTINSFGLGFEAPVNRIPSLHFAGLVKKTLNTSTPSFELRSFFEHSKKLNLNLSLLSLVSKFKSQTNGTSSDAETKVLQVEVGLTYKF